jgi:hypothetical protein
VSIFAIREIETVTVPAQRDRSEWAGQRYFVRFKPGKGDRDTIWILLVSGLQIIEPDPCPGKPLYPMKTWRSREAAERTLQRIEAPMEASYRGSLEVAEL